jgi:hypothetical protein
VLAKAGRGNETAVGRFSDTATNAWKDNGEGGEHDVQLATGSTMTR